MIKKIVYLISLCSLMFILFGCGKEAGGEEETQAVAKMDTIDCVSGLSCDIPSKYRENAISKTEYEEEKAKIDSTFDTGVVESQTNEIYRITDYKSFLFNFYNDAQLGVDLFYVNNLDSINALFKDSAGVPTFSATGDFQKVEKDGVIKVSADVSFVALFEEGTTASSSLKGKVVFVQYDGKQYLGLFGVDEDSYDKESMNNIANSFNYTGKESSLLSASAKREEFTYTGATASEQILIKPCALWTLQTDNTLYCSEYGAVVTVSIMDSGVNREITADEMYSSFSPEGFYDNVEIIWTEQIVSKDGQEWLNKVFKIKDDTGEHCNLFFATAKERSVYFYECAYPDEADTQKVVELVKDMCMYSLVEKYIPLNATPATTEVVTSEEETSEEDSANTEETTEATTEKSVEATEAQTTEQATTTAPKKNTTKKQTKEKDDLDVEW